MGADSKSTNFYLKVKGETEDFISQLNFLSFASFRPSILLGNRTEFRLGEYIGKTLMSTLSFVFIGKLKRYKAIHVNQVASAMIKLVKANVTGKTIIENEEML